MEVSITQQVGWITFNRPKKGNSLTPGMLEKIKESINQFETDPNVRVIVMTGKGKRSLRELFFIDCRKFF